VAPEKIVSAIIGLMGLLLFAYSFYVISESTPKPNETFHPWLFGVLFGVQTAWSGLKNAFNSADPIAK
jgi:ABC-type branched-subunit amino acid transport system permease subunit